jgi:hypothetical protein
MIQKNSEYNLIDGLFSTEINGEFITGEVKDLIKLTNNYPIVSIPISKIPDIPHHSDPEENIYIMNADLNYPIIIIVNEDKITGVLDGNHRIQKSIYMGKKRINSKLVSQNIIKKHFGKSKLRESIIKILKGELEIKQYLKRRVDLIETLLIENMSYLQCHSLGGYESFEENVLRGVYLDLKNNFGFPEDEYEDEYEDEPLSENREVLYNYLLEKYESILKEKFISVCGNRK